MLRIADFHGALCNVARGHGQGPQPGPAARMERGEIGGGVAAFTLLPYADFASGVNSPMSARLIAAFRAGEKIFAPSRSVT